MTREELVALLSGGLDATPAFVGAGVLICHTPHVAPLAYLHRIYPRLHAEDLVDLEAQLGTNIPESFANFLTRVGNGARFFNISIDGLVGQLRRDPADKLGQPISLDYGNIYERPPGLAEDTLAIGGMVGWSSRGCLVMQPGGEVLLVHPSDGRDVVARWDSLDAMLRDEIARQYEFHDRSGRRLVSHTEAMHPAGRRWETEIEPAVH
jgi:hypothetical protein